jgi:hypothetical protein
VDLRQELLGRTRTHQAASIRTYTKCEVVVTWWLISVLSAVLSPQF